MRILFTGAPVGPHAQAATMTWQQKFNYSGSNTGNTLIGQSLREELDVTDFAYGLRVPPEEANDRFDMIVLPAANWIFKNFDMYYYADYIEATKLPCMMVGLGAQAPAAGANMSAIPEGTKRLLKIVADRSSVIGVRGAFTAQVMNDFGYKNVEALGCPSLYRTMNPNLKIKRPNLNEDLVISLNGSSNVVEHSSSPKAARNVESQLLQLSILHGYNYVLQNETPELNALLKVEGEPDDLPTLETLARRSNLPVGGHDYAEHIRTKFKVFFDLATWDSYIKDFDVSIGSRFHGNLIALTNGVPSVIITHDSRTTEMSELMGIPHVSVRDVDKLDVKELIKTADFDHFERRYAELYSAYKAFLTKNGAKNKL